MSDSFSYQLLYIVKSVWDLSDLHQTSLQLRQLLEGEPVLDDITGHVVDEDENNNKKKHFKILK